MVRWQEFCKFCCHTFVYRIDVPLGKHMWVVEDLRLGFNIHRVNCMNKTKAQLKNRLKELV